MKRNLNRSKLKMGLTAATILLSLFILGCRGEEKLTEDGSNTGSSGSAEDDIKKKEDINPNAFSVSVQADSRYTYFIHKGTGQPAEDWNAKCEILPSDSDKDIECVVEAHELDLFFFGIGIRVNVPPTMCSFLVQRRPYFYKYEPGAGPTTAVDNTNGNQTNSGVAQGANTLTCPYDYTALKGPNCCSGSYTKIVYSTTNVATVTPNQSWGGKAANCLAGPAMTLSPIAESGFPLGVLSYVEGTGFNEGYFLAAPITGNLISNIGVANFFNAADHVGGLPKMFRAGAGFPATVTHHEFDCLDRAREKLASIKVLVREWNTVAELAKKSAGDPDSTGNEPVYGTPNNDFDDIKDLGEFYPGLAL